MGIAIMIVIFIAICFWLPPSLSGPIYEEDYSVKTVLQAYKLGIKPYHICADVAGNSIFVLDSINNNIHKFSLPLSQGSSTDLVAGSAKGKAGYVDDQPQLSLFDKPRSLTIDAAGNLYIADKNNHAVRKCTHKAESGYAVETIFDGQKLDIVPSSVCNSMKGNDLFLLDKAHSTISKLSLPLSQNKDLFIPTPDGLLSSGVLLHAYSHWSAVNNSTVEVVTGSPERGSGYVDGEPTVSLFSSPRDLATDTRGNVYVADGLNFAIRKIRYSDGYVTTIAGGTSPGKTDGPGSTAKFSRDFALLFVPHMCCLLVTDRGNQLIREIKLKPADCSSKSTFLSGKIWTVILVACLAIGALIIITFIILCYTMRREIAEILLAILTSFPQLVWSIFLFIRSLSITNRLQAQSQTPLQNNRCIDQEKDLIDLNTDLDGCNDLNGSNTTEECSISSDHHTQDPIDRMREKCVENLRLMNQDFRQC